MSAHLIPIRLYQILEEHSDQEHPLSMGELRRLLRVEYGVSCDRRTIYGALDSLRRAGCDIPDFQDSKDGYFLLSRKLEPAEVRLLLDCAFGKLGAKKVTNCFEPSREAALKIHKAAGFQVEKVENGLLYLGITRET